MAWWRCVLRHAPLRRSPHALCGCSLPAAAARVRRLCALRVTQHLRKAHHHRSLSSG
jgi:hypothetical protein